MAEKLTRAQASLLADIAKMNRTIAPKYPPAMALVRRDLAVWVEGRWGDKLQITESGRAALASL